MARIAYIRVSTKEQNTGRQYELLRERNIIPDKIYEEKVSGKNIDRPELKAMLSYVREGDTVYIESISRLARNTRDFLNLVEYLQGKQVDLVSLKESIDTATPTGKFMLSVFAALYQLERQNTLLSQYRLPLRCHRAAEPGTLQPSYETGEVAGVRSPGAQHFTQAMGRTYCRGTACNGELVGATFSGMASRMPA